MVPSLFVPLKQLPLNSHGKVDRLNLPKPNLGRSGMGSFVAPTNEVEQKLAEIWSEIFPNIGGVGISDDFFDLGGDSISAIRIVTRANQLGVPIETKQIFSCGNIAKISAEIAKAKIEAPTSVDEIQEISKTILTDELMSDFTEQTELEFRDHVETLYSVTPLQEGMIFHSLLHPFSEQYVPQYTWKIVSKPGKE